MYVIQIDNGGTSTVIHEAGTSDVKVDSAKISREVNKFDSLTFDIYPDNPGFDELTEFSTLVTVTNVKTGKVAFDGRVIQVEPEMDDEGAISKTVTCESVMGYLCDSMQMWEEEEHYSDQGTTSGLEMYLDKLLDRHNAAIEAHKQILLGNVTMQTFDTSGGVTKGIDRASTWDNIEDKLIGVFGGEMRVRRGTNGLLYLDYAQSLGTTRATAIEVARNMETAQRSVDPNDVITRLYPFGCKLTTTETDPDTGEETEVETEERLTIESVNGGVAYIDDSTAMARYGIIEGYHEWDDVTVPANLLSKAQQWLGENNALPVSHTFDAYDLSLLGLDYDAFEIFDRYPCRNQLIGLDETLEIVKQTIDINEPENSSFDMGEAPQRLSGSINDAATKGDVQNVQSQVNTSVTNVNNRVTSTAASIAVMEDRISQTVSKETTETVTEIVAALDEAVQAAQDAANQAQLDADAAASQAAQAAGVAGGTVLVQPTSPSATYQRPNVLWIDTAGGGAVPKTWDGTHWATVTYDGAAEAAQDAAEAQQAADEAWAALTQATQDALKSVQQAADEAQSTANGLAQTVTTIESQITELEQTNEGWSFNFQTIQEELTQLGDEVSTTYYEQLKYIKFIDGEIWLGRDPDPGQDDFKVVISNERIRFLQNNVEVAYLSNNKLFVTSAQILSDLQLGAFAFFPRENGSLSFRLK